MNYSNCLIQSMKEKALKAYESLPDAVKKYNMPEVNKEMSGLSKMHDKLDYLEFIKPVNDLVLAGQLDFDVESPLEEIVEHLKNKN